MLVLRLSIEALKPLKAPCIHRTYISNIITSLGNNSDGINSI